jgi:hypothetical protein
MDTFYLGTHRPHWLGLVAVPLFVSRRRLARYRRLPRARAPWVLDSGGFSELALFGGYQTTAAQYVAEVRRYADEIGGLEWVAPQDWMCEPSMLVRTGLTVAQHQDRTLASCLDLRAADLPVPVIPVIQGWHLDDYLRHVEAFDRADWPLDREPLVAVGSTCRRADVRSGERIVRRLAADGLRLHGFGVKLTGLGRFGDILATADSMAWSYQGRRGSGRAPGCPHARCANCLRWALLWYARVVARLAAPQQGAWGF